MKTDELVYRFPCEFPIKAFGLATDDFEIDVLMIIRQYAPNLKENAISSRTSKDGKYLSITVTITAENKSQLDAIYQALSSSKHVIMAL